MKEIDLVIREESFGYLIWSKKSKKYFLPATNEASTFIASLVQNEKISDCISQDLIKEFYNIGGSINFELIKNDSENYLSAPLDVYLDYTWICNLADTCGKSLCYAKNNLGKVFLDKSELEIIIHNLRKRGVMRLHLAGGEPLAQPSILSYYLYCSDLNGMTSSITTNGLLLNAKNIELLCKTNVLSVTISLDGHDDKSNDDIRGKGTYKKACSGVKNLVKYVKKHRKELVIALKPVILPEYDEDWFYRYIDQAEKLGVDEVRFNNPERCTLNPKGHYGEIKNKYYSSLLLLNKVFNDYSGEVKLKIANNPINGCEDIGIPGLQGCIGGQELITIHPNGKVTPCTMNEFDLGTIYDFDFDILKVINESVAFKSFKKQLELNEECKSCTFLKKCRGGSQTRKIVEYGHFNKVKDPLCFTEYLKENSKDFYINKSKRRLHFKPIHVAHSL